MHEAIQDGYPDDVAHCFGCGRLNDEGLHVRSHWDGDETVARLLPAAHYIAIPGVVYGGLLASLVDCHGVGTAAAAIQRQTGGLDQPVPRCVTASLQVDFLRPTPTGVELEARGVVREVSARKGVIAVTVLAGDEVTVTGRVVAVRLRT